MPAEEEIPDEIADFLAIIEDACNHDWVIKNRPWKYVSLTDQDGDGIGGFDVETGLAFVAAVRQTFTTPANVEKVSTSTSVPKDGKTYIVFDDGSFSPINDVRVETIEAMIYP